MDEMLLMKERSACTADTEPKNNRICSEACYPAIIRLSVEHGTKLKECIIGQTVNILCLRQKCSLIFHSLVIFQFPRIIVSMLSKHTHTNTHKRHY